MNDNHKMPELDKLCLDLIACHKRIAEELVMATALMVGITRIMTGGDRE